MGLVKSCFVEFNGVPKGKENSQQETISIFHFQRFWAQGGGKTKAPLGL